LKEDPFNTDPAVMPILGGCTLFSEIVEFSDPGFDCAESNFAAKQVPKAGDSRTLSSLGLQYSMSLPSFVGD
jgi:hypothetical protein